MVYKQFLYRFPAIAETQLDMNQPRIKSQYNYKDQRLHPDLFPPAEFSVVLGTRNRKAMLQKCLNALIGKIKTNHQIIVIDAGSTDGTIDYIKSNKEIHLVCDGKPLGQAQSYNRVFKSLKSKYICWLSDDNIVQPGALDSAVSILRKKSKIGLVALKAKDIIGNRLTKPYIGGRYKTGILNCNQGVIRSDLFQKIGYFDETFKNYGIDPDVTTKVLLSGYSVVYTKAIAIHHFRDRNFERGSISTIERKINLKRVHKKYNDRYAYLIDGHLSKKHDATTKELVWRCINVLNKRLEKKGLRLETITGKNRKDWKNLTHCQYISIIDIFYNMNNSYYLKQHMPKKIL